MTFVELLILDNEGFVLFICFFFIMYMGNNLYFKNLYLDILSKIMAILTIIVLVVCWVQFRNKYNWNQDGLRISLIYTDFSNGESIMEDPQTYVVLHEINKKSIIENDLDSSHITYKESSNLLGHVNCRFKGGYLKPSECIHRVKKMSKEQLLGFLTKENKVVAK
jgi:hypothetical protein